MKTELQESFEEAKVQGVSDSEALLSALQGRMNTLRWLEDTAIQPETATRATVQIRALEGVVSLVESIVESERVAVSA